MENPNSSNPFLGTHLPITLLGVAFSLFFLTQLQEAGIEADGLALQKTATVKTASALTAQIEKNKKELDDRAALVAQSEKIQQDFATESKTVKDRTTTAAQFEQLHKQLEELKLLVEKGKTEVANSEAVQQTFTDFMKELDALRIAGDPDAALIMTTYGIQINDPKKEAPKTEEKP